MAKSLPTSLQLLRFSSQTIHNHHISHHAWSWKYHNSHYNLCNSMMTIKLTFMTIFRSSRPPPRACSRQVSTDQSRKQVRMTTKMMMVTATTMMMMMTLVVCVALVVLYCGNCLKLQQQQILSFFLVAWFVLLSLSLILYLWSRVTDVSLQH